MGSNCIVTASIDQRLRLWNFIVSTKIEVYILYLYSVRVVKILTEE